MTICAQTIRYTSVYSVAVWACAPVDADAMSQSLIAGRRVQLDEVGMFADGVAVPAVGAHTFPIAHQTVTEVIRVNNDAAPRLKTSSTTRERLSSGPALSPWRA